MDDLLASGKYFAPHSPVAPVNLVLISSFLFVRLVSQEAQAYNLVPLMWSRKILPIAQLILRSRLPTTMNNIVTSLAVPVVVVLWKSKQKRMRHVAHDECPVDF